MIKVIARSVIKENHLSDALEIYKHLVAETVKETGCIAYELFQELNNPNSLTLIEKELPVLIYKKLF